MHKRIKILFTITAIILFACLAETCYAYEGFLLIKDDVTMYSDKDCKVAISKQRPLYKFTYGLIWKRESGKIYIEPRGWMVLGQEKVPVWSTQKARFWYWLPHSWIDESAVIQFQCTEISECGDKATRIFLKKYFP